MDDAAGALRPLDEAAAAVERLRHYTSTNQLASAVQEVWSAVRRSLRARLRADAQAPDEHRLSALSETDLPLDDVVRSLRSRDRISLETAGAIHALKGAAERAAEGEPRAQDADTALDAVRRLRADLAEPPAATPPSPTGDARPGGGQADDAGSEGAGSGRRKSQARPAGTNSVVDTGAQDDVPPERRGRWMALIAVALAAVFLLALAWVLVRGANADYDDAVAAFRAGRLDSAAVAFEGLVRDQPENVTALLYLGRIHRRQGNPEDAAEVLRRAAGVDSRDPDVRRELGHLFMDLQRPEAAVAQYERALEQDPDELRNWAGLIRAMRASGDPRAEALLSEAPADVQALLARPDTPTQGRD